MHNITTILNTITLQKNSIKKIALIGSPGSGKTTLALHLNKFFNLPVYHLDKYSWQANWKKTADTYIQHYYKTIYLTHEWIIDGNHIATLPLRCSQADLIIIFNLPRWQCINGIITRWFFYRSKQRFDLATGCFDQLNKNFLLYAWHFRQRYQTILKHHATQSNALIIELTTIQDVIFFTNHMQPNTIKTTLQHSPH